MKEQMHGKESLSFTTLVIKSLAELYSNLFFPEPGLIAFY